MNVTPAAETIANLEPMAALESCFCKVWQLDAASIGGTSAHSVDQRAIDDGGPNLRMGSRESK